MKTTVSKESRKNIFDSLRVLNTNWAGQLEDSDFLARIFDLENLPSYDYRFPTASGDIWQHRVNNPNDWDDDWIFSDDRFNLLNCDDEIFLCFLCEMIHPVVRSDHQETERLLQLFNELLANDGFEIVERSRIAHRPVYAARRKIDRALLSVNSAKDLATSFDAEYLSKQITRLETAVLHDPELAIGTAKELVETCCKTIMTERNEKIDKNWNLSQLVKNTCKILKLTPADIPESAKAADTIKRLLSNLATVTQGLAELRNQYGTGHGRNATTKGLSSRHAKLAVGAATTLVIFLFETHLERR